MSTDNTKNEINDLKGALALRDLEVKALRKQVADLEFDLDRRTAECEAHGKVREAFRIIMENT